MSLAGEILISIVNKRTINGDGAITTQANGMEGQRAGERSSKNSAQAVASSAHNNFLPENTAHDRIALNDSAEVVPSSAADRNALNGALGSPCEAAGTREHSDVVVASSAHKNFPEKSAHALGSPCEAAGIREQSKNSEEVVASSAHNNFLPEISARDRNALNGALGSLCEAAAGHNESTDSRQHEAPPCEAIKVSSSANNNSFPEKAALNRDDLHHRNGCINNGSALWHTEGSPCEAAGHNEAADGSQQQLKSYTWHGMQIALPAALRLCKWCSLEDGVLEVRGSDATLREGMLLLDAAALDLQYDIVDGALGLKLPCSQYSDMLPGPVSQLLGLWEKRSGLVHKYTVSGSSGMIYNSSLSKLLIANCCIFDSELFAAAKIADSNLGHVVPRDLQAEVVFECVSATDDVTKIWEKCESYISSNRAKMAIGICDRADQKEVLIAYRDFRGDVTSEVQQDPRLIDLGRVLRGFRIYLSYMIPTIFMHFTVHHVYNLRTMPDDNRQLLLCTQITQGGNALAMEIVNGLATVNFNDSMGRNPLLPYDSAVPYKVLNTLAWAEVSTYWLLC